MTYSTHRRVEFRDTDAAGIVHFSAFFPMMEAAEHEMLRSLGIAVLPTGESKLPAVTWPRVAASCSYASAARFEDLLTIDVNVDEIGTTSVQYRFRFSREGELIAEGKMVAVCCRVPQRDLAGADRGGADRGGADRGGMGPQTGGLEKTPIPEPIRQLLAQHQ